MKSTATLSVHSRAADWHFEVGARGRPTWPAPRMAARYPWIPPAASCGVVEDAHLRRDRRAELSALDTFTRTHSASTDCGCPLVASVLAPRGHAPSRHQGTAHSVTGLLVVTSLAAPHTQGREQHTGGSSSHSSSGYGTMLRAHNYILEPTRGELLINHSKHNQLECRLGS